MYKKPKRCPECGMLFVNIKNAWWGIDAHWKAEHLNIMEYFPAWKIIRRGLRPSDHV